MGREEGRRVRLGRPERLFKHHQLWLRRYNSDANKEQMVDCNGAVL
jgi:hypothetical protein